MIVEGNLKPEILDLKLDTGNLLDTFFATSLLRCEIAYGCSNPLVLRFEVSIEGSGPR